MKAGANGFSNNPFMIGYDNSIFEGDRDLGFKFPGERVISRAGFVSLDKLIQKIKGRTGYLSILNVGDSSTSGWDSNKTFNGNENPDAPFFNYKTYSDLLDEQQFANVINAGVPGYTSHQGRKYVEILLKRLASEKVRIDYITIYLGNNDCTYNQIEDKVLIDRKQHTKQNNGARVIVADYKRNLRSMIETAREYAIKPVLIVPAIHYDWEPGVRADKYRDESIAILNQLGDCLLSKEMQKAKALYNQGKFKQACQTDRVLPRLKKEYRHALIQVARETKTDLIDVQSQIPLIENSEFFADYCHPLEKVNQMIVDKFVEIRNRDLFHKPLFNTIKTWFNDLYPQKEDLGRPPSDIYAMY
jgi:lysophospholipase L1-like esterase